MSTTHSHRWQAAAVVALLATTLSAGAASAVILHDPRPPELSTASHAPTDHPCWLARVGTQFAGCDNLTGNAVPAPGWVPQH